jgi:peptidoglycan hydrolase-like protein with peptidoglycan-binding domain
MRFGKFIFVTSALILSAATAAAHAAPRVHRGPTSPRLFKARTAAPKPRTIAHIDAERSTQIQTALIHSGYLTGTPTGVWDAQTQGAMEKLQADNGWQTKLVPDARAIIKLGLGPGSASAGEPANGNNESIEAAAPTGELAPGTPANK